MWWIIGIIVYFIMWFAMSMISVHSVKKSDDVIDYTECTLIGSLWPFTLPLFVLLQMFDVMRRIIRKVGGDG